MNAPDMLTLATHVETLVRFGEGRRLTGTLCEPAASAEPDSSRPSGADRPVLLVFNAGVLPRTGPHRLNVKIARRFARAGWTVFRFDLSGQGDSLAAGGTLGFERQSIADLRAAMDALGERLGATRFASFGICSGAVLGYACALEDPRLVGCAMFDPYLYPTWRTPLYRMRAVIRRDGLWPVLAGFVRRRLAPGAPATPATSGVNLGLQDPPKAEFAAGLQALLARGVALRMLYSGSALYHYNYPGQFDDGFRAFGLAGRIRADFLPEVDHTVTAVAAQRFLVEHLLQWMDETLAR